MPGSATPILRGKSLNKQVAHLVTGRGEENQEALQELGEQLLAHWDAEDTSDKELSLDLPEQFGNGAERATIAPPSESARFLAGQFCSDSAFGGAFEAELPNLKEALRSLGKNSSDGQMVVYDPSRDEPEFNHQSLFGLLRGFDKIVGSDFSGDITRFLEARSKLGKQRTLILGAPLVAFGGQPELRAQLGEYLDAYASILRQLHQNEATLHEHDAEATKMVLLRLLRLDVVTAWTPEGAKSVLTPFHPFNLWRYREVFAELDKGQSLDADTLESLEETLGELPQQLNFVLPHDREPGEISRFLPYAGDIDALASFENHTNRFLGTDGLDFLGDLLRRFRESAPYVTPRMQLALVDVPNVAAALKICGNYLEEFQRAGVRLAVRFYFTDVRKELNERSELARLDWDGQDSDLAEALARGRLLLEIQRVAKQFEVTEILKERPVHLAFFFDGAGYSIRQSPLSRGLVVNPLVVTYEYTYSKALQTGNIAPSSQGNEGVFADFHALVERTNIGPTGTLPALHLDSGGKHTVEGLEDMTQSGATRWLAVADRMLTPYKFSNAVPLGELRRGGREVGIWASGTSRQVKRFVDELRSYNFAPEADVVSQLLRKFGHIAAGGALTLPPSHLARDSAKNAFKGLLGTLLAVTWYRKRYPDALIASLDSPMARQWLGHRALGDSQSRADLVGIRFEGQSFVVEAIEVKTRENEDEVRVAAGEAPVRYTLGGEAIEQLKVTLGHLEEIFALRSADEPEPIFVKARRETLKYQIFRECFREVHNPEWREAWSERLNQLFKREDRLYGVSTRGVVLHLRLNKGDDVWHVADSGRPLDLFRLGAKALAPLVTTSLPVDDEKGELPVFTSPQKEVSETSSVFETPAQRVASSDTEDDIPQKIAAPTTNITLSDDATQNEEARELVRLFKRACGAHHISLARCDAADFIYGPNVWRLPFQLEGGQRISKLQEVQPDMSREMKRSGIMFAEIPNSNLVALDIPVPESKRKFPLLNEVLGLLPPPAPQAPEGLPFFVGQTPEGDLISSDLSTLPHLLVGGTTGAGKSIFLHSLLTQFLVTHPDAKTLRLLLSTSKPEDFFAFEGLPHLEEKHVISDAREMIQLLETRVEVASAQRQKLFTEMPCANIIEYNKKSSNPLPPFVVIADEFADLADQLPKKGEREVFYDRIKRIATVGRSRGIFLVLCTQRPSADLVPPKIRSHLNGRVALRVNDGVASRMILDENGAQLLQKHGDLLFKNDGIPRRAQGFFLPPEDLMTILSPLK